MSRKNTLEPVYVTASQAVPINDPIEGINTNAIPTQSLAASFNTIPTSVKYQDNLSYQININTTNSVGTFELQGSNDGVTYDNLTLAGVVNAANDVSLININQFPFAWMRLSYTATTAGTGTCQIILMARNVGA